MVGGRESHDAFFAWHFCRAALDTWDADPHRTEYVQVEASALRAVLERLAPADLETLDLRAGVFDLS